MDWRNDGEGVKTTRMPEILLTVNSSAAFTPWLENEMRSVPSYKDCCPYSLHFHIIVFFALIRLNWVQSLKYL
jgi:hypothetical protein